MSSYDPPADVTGIITEGEMRRSMQLVRLQIATPLSLLMTIGANLVCALAIKPGLGKSLCCFGVPYVADERFVADINKMYPTCEKTRGRGLSYADSAPLVLSPNPIMIGIFWILLYSLQIGLCLILVMARKDETKVSFLVYLLCRSGVRNLRSYRFPQATLVHGVGLRFAIANWLQAAWAVAWVRES
jgi:hypothetical protein